MKRIALFLGILSLTASACSQTPQLKPLDPHAKILAFGDSITSGTGAARGEDYPSVLSSILRRDVLNAGVNGELSADGLRRLPEWLENHHPGLMILCHGGNDLIRGVDPRVTASNIRRMITLAQKSGTEVLLIGVPRPGLILVTAGFYGDISRELSVPYEGKILSRILSSPAFKADQIHPNARGYRLMAEAIVILLKKSGAI